MFQAKTRINKLLWKHFYKKGIFTTVKAALELNLNRFVIAVFEKHIMHFKAIYGFFGLLPGFYISVQFAIFSYGMPPKLASTARFLAFFQLYPLFFLVFWQLHAGNIEKFKKEVPQCVDKQYFLIVPGLALLFLLRL